MNANPEGIKALVAKWREDADTITAKAAEKNHGGGYRWTDWRRGELNADAARLRRCADELESLTAVAGGAVAQTGDWIAADDVRRLVRQIDVALNGEAGAAKQASLCDIAAQVSHHARLHGPVFATRQAVEGMVPRSEVQALLELYSNDEASDEPQTEHDLGYEQACAEFAQHLSGLLAAAAPQAGKGEGNGL